MSLKTDSKTPVKHADKVGDRGCLGTWARSTEPQEQREHNLHLHRNISAPPCSSTRARRAHPSAEGSSSHVALASR